MRGPKCLPKNIVVASNHQPPVKIPAAFVSHLVPRGRGAAAKEPVVTDTKDFERLSQDWVVKKRGVASSESRAGLAGELNRHGSCPVTVISLSRRHRAFFTASEGGRSGWGSSSTWGR